MKKPFTIRHLRPILIIITLLSITACGYKPSSQFAREVIGTQVYTEIEVSLSDPENAVLVKDAINKALYTRLKTKVTRREKAESHINVVYEGIKFLPLQYDKNGYVVYYQANITLGFSLEKGEKREKRKIVGRYEFPIRPSAIISNDLRLKAIEKGSLKALDQFIAYISVRGALTDEK